jgi:hypothetical protein
MPTLVVGMFGNTEKQVMPTTSVGMAPNTSITTFRNRNVLPCRVVTDHPPGLRSSSF